MPKFWDYIHDDSSGRVLRLEGPIDSDSFWGDEITPQDFRDELYAEDGDLTLWINSPGGNVFAAAEIYTMIRDYPHNVTVRIASIAASAASVIAMAGNTVQMSPTALLMIHDPSTIAFGNAKDMEKAIATLNEVKESIINAYAAKTGLSRNRISKLMSDETWINAKKASSTHMPQRRVFPETASANSCPMRHGSMRKRRSSWALQMRSSLTKSRNRTRSRMSLTIRTSLRSPIRKAVTMRAMKRKRPKRSRSSWTPAMPFGSTVPVSWDRPFWERSPLPHHAEDAQKPAEEGLRDTAPIVTTPVIGMDGKTADGAMPYEILKQQLAFLR